MNAWSASTANENDMNKRNSCLHKQQNQEYLDVSAKKGSFNFIKELIEESKSNSSSDTSLQCQRNIQGQ